MDEVDKKARELLKEPTPGVRAFTIGGEEQRDVLAKGDKEQIEGSNVIQGLDETERAFSLAGAIEPPYNPVTLTALYEHSNSLRPNVDSYATNIDGHGHRFEPVIDLDGTDADQKVEYAVILERQRLKEDVKPGQGLPELYGQIQALDPRPTPGEVALKKELLRDQMRFEKTKLEYFFEYCCAELSFSSLRRRTRQDLEVLGNGFWEVLRNGVGEVAQFTYIPAFTVRLLPLESRPMDVAFRTKVSDLDYDTVQVKKRFRKFIQVFEHHVVHFKEYGDPRVISRRTGRVFVDDAALLVEDPTDGPATELIHFKLHNPRSSYGVPRWTGQLLSVLGSRQAEEINYLYFENKSVPPLALLVSGGRVSAETVNRLRDHIENEIKGKKNFHKLMIIEATPDSQTLTNTGTCRIVLQPLTQAQQNDALFQNYDERNIDKVGNAFRLPRLLRGDVRDFNRATADAALDFAEQQVFAPEREEFDFLINRKILPELGIRFFKYRSNAPTTRDPMELAQIIKLLAEASVITPEEARQAAAGVFNKDLKKIEALWAEQPMALTLAQLSAGMGLGPAIPESDLGTADVPEGDAATNKDAGGTVSSGDLAAGGALQPAQGVKPGHGLRHLPPPYQTLIGQAKALLKIRKALFAAEQSEALEAFATGKATADETVETLYVTREEMDKFVVRDVPEPTQ